MAARGRDLKVSILSDVDKFDLSKPADDLETLGEAAKDTGRVVEDSLDKLDDAAKDSANSLEALTKEGTRTADKLDNAFDSIARSSRSNLRNKLDDDVDKAKKGLDDLKDEAGESGREAAASFSGEFTDITDAVQEIAAQAFAGFGPLGAAAGIAAAAGIGIITKIFSDSKEKAEKAKEEIAGFFDAFVEGQGRITEAAIQGKLEELLGDPETYRQIAKDAKEANISVELLARARAGDVKAIRAVTTQIQNHTKALDANKHITTDLESSQLQQRNALDRVSESLGVAKGNITEANKAWTTLDRATRAGIVADVDVKAPTKAELRREHLQMQRELGRRVNVPVHISPPSGREIDAVNRAIRRGIGTIVVPVKPGQSRFTNTSSNSRYRN